MPHPNEGQGFLSRILGRIAYGSQKDPWGRTPGINPNAQDPYTKRPSVAPTIGGGPLDQYIQTPAQKLLMQQQMEQQQQMQQQLMRLQAAHMSPEQRNYYNLSPIAEGLGSKLGGFLRSKMPGAQEAQAAQQQAMESQQAEFQGIENGFLDAVQKHGSYAKAQVEYGRQLMTQYKDTNPELARMGSQLYRDGQVALDKETKEAAELDKTRSETAENKAQTDSSILSTEQSKTGKKPLTHGDKFDWIDENGNEVSAMWDANEGKMKILGKGQRTTNVKQGTPEEWGLTPTQQGNEVIDWDNLNIGYNALKEQISRVKANIQATPGSSGTAGEILLQVKQFGDTTKSIFGTVFGANNMAKDYKSFGDNIDWDSFEQSAGTRAVNKAIIKDIAYTYAKLRYDQKGQGLSDRDIKHVMERIGQAYSDPRLMVKLLDELDTDLGNYVRAYGSQKGFIQNKPVAPPKPGAPLIKHPDNIQAILNDPRYQQ